MTTTYRFFWSPEGRPLCDITATSRKQAKTVFKARFGQYARYMGEVYVEENPVEYRGIPAYVA